MGSFVRKVASGVTIGMVTAIITTAVVAGGLAYATGTENVPNNSVTSAKIVNATIQSIDIKNATVAAIDVVPSLRPRWVSVETSDPSMPTIELQRGDAQTVDNAVNIGQFVVEFATSVSNCGYVATLNQGGASAEPGQITAVRDPVNPNAVVVWTFDEAGVPEDQHDFTLQLLC